jgi:hypothetical protein
MDSDFNPGFSFDFGSSAAVDAPYEYGGMLLRYLHCLWVLRQPQMRDAGALKQALKERGQQKASTIDQKIHSRLQASKAHKKASGRLPRAALHQKR